MLIFASFSFFFFLFLLLLGSLSRVLFFFRFVLFEFRFRRQFLSYVFGVGLFSESLLLTISFHLPFACVIFGDWLLNFASLMHAPLSGLLFKLRDYCRFKLPPTVPAHTVDSLAFTLRSH